MMPYGRTAFEALVILRPVITPALHCPCCRKRAAGWVDISATATTRPHTRTAFHCQSCGARVEDHTYDGDRWIVVDGVVVEGEIGCDCGTEAYACRQCRGRVRRSYHDYVTDAPVTSRLWTADFGNHDYRRWTCDTCGRFVNEYEKSLDTPREA